MNNLHGISDFDSMNLGKKKKVGLKTWLNAILRIRDDELAVVTNSFKHFVIKLKESSRHI